MCVDEFSATQRSALFRRTLVVVAWAAACGGLGIAATAVVGAVLAQQLTGNDAITGLPAGLMTIGSASTIFVLGRVTSRWGRRRALIVGYLTGALGALGVVLAAALPSVPLLFLSFLISGAGPATNLQLRYAGTDLAPATRRGTAVSVALVATTLGAVVGPNSVTWLGQVAADAGLPRLSGPFCLSFVAFSASAVIVILFLTPDPYLTALRWATPQTTEGALVSGRERVMTPGVVLGGLVIIVPQVVMVAIMTMTPVHMRHHHHSWDVIGLVISLHIAAMFFPSLVTGPLVDRLGRIPMAAAAGVTLLASGLTGALAPPESTVGLTVALILLGLGWNFGMIAGTSLVVDSTTASTRAKAQSNVDVFVSLSGAGAGAVSGLAMTQSSYTTLCLAGGVLACVVGPILWCYWWFQSRPVSR